MRSLKWLHSPVTLLLGDWLALAAVTVIGFSSHGTLSSAPDRFWATFLPLAAVWAISAELGGLAAPRWDWDRRRAASLGWLAALSAAVAVLLRGLALARPVEPTFALVMMVASAAALLLWRSLWVWLASREVVA
jgi:hypothetical protein